MDDAEREWRAHTTQIAKIDSENKMNCKEYQVVTNTIEEAIRLNNCKFADEHQ